MNSVRAGLFDKLVDEADVGESSSGHNFVVTSASTIGVEVLGADTTTVQVLGSG